MEKTNPRRGPKDVKAELSKALGQELAIAASAADPERVAGILAAADKSGAEPWRYLDGWNRSALSLAADRTGTGAVACVELLAARGMARARGAPEGWTPLMIAARAGEEDSARALLTMSDVGAIDVNGQCALMLACSEARVGAALILLAAAPERAVAVDSNGMDALMLGSQHDARLASALLEAGADPRRRDCDGWSALMHASRAGRADSVAALLAAGAKPLARSKTGMTPLMAAAAAGCMGSIELLAPHGGIASVDAKGHGAAEWARRESRPAAASWLGAALMSKAESKVLRRARGAEPEPEVTAAGRPRRRL